jgi:hypothetical protein
MSWGAVVAARTGRLGMAAIVIDLGGPGTLRKSRRRLQIVDRERVGVRLGQPE